MRSVALLAQSDYSGMALSSSLSASDTELDALRRERDALRLELDRLRAQGHSALSPHFLFNSLNNLYGTALTENSPQTAERIEQLSGVMRYLLEDARAPFVSLRRELRFLDDYLHLQRIRLPQRDTIQLTINLDWDERPGHLMPLLLHPILDNAFASGISIQRPCFVNVNLKIEGGMLALTVQHSVLSATVLPSKAADSGSGFDPDRFRQRLQRGYPNRHTLTISETDDVFSVYLTITL
jgi:LytS/YehU family sensor histidine kinase